MNEFHQPFIKSLIVVGLVTVFAMVSSRIVVNYYSNLQLKSSYTVQSSNFNSK